MADPTQTPEALKRLVERLNGVYRIPITDGHGPAGGEEPDNPNEFVRTFEAPPIQREAAAAISALTAEQDARDGEIAAAVECCKDYAAAREQAEATLREIAEIMSGGVDFEDDATESMSKLRRVSKIARSTSQGGEG